MNRQCLEEINIVCSGVDVVSSGVVAGSGVDVVGSYGIVGSGGSIGGCSSRAVVATDGIVTVVVGEDDVGCKGCDVFVVDGNVVVCGGVAGDWGQNIKGVVVVFVFFIAYCAIIWPVMSVFYIFVVNI